MTKISVTCNSKHLFLNPVSLVCLGVGWPDVAQPGLAPASAWIWVRFIFLCLSFFLDQWAIRGCYCRSQKHKRASLTKQAHFKCLLTSYFLTLHRPKLNINELEKYSLFMEVRNRGGRDYLLNNNPVSLKSLCVFLARHNYY